MRPQIERTFMDGFHRFGFRFRMRFSPFFQLHVADRDRIRRWGVAELELQDKIIEVGLVRGDGKLLHTVDRSVGCDGLPVQCFVALFDGTVVVADFKSHRSGCGDLCRYAVGRAGFQVRLGIDEDLGFPDTLILRNRRDRQRHAGQRLLISGIVRLRRREIDADILISFRYIDGMLHFLGCHIRIAEAR